MYEHLGLDEVKAVRGRSGNGNIQWPWMADGFAVINDSRFLSEGLVRCGVPYLIEDYRMGVVLGGEACCTVNLEERRLAAGDIVLLRHGSIIRFGSISPDYSMVGMLASRPTVLRLMGGTLPPLLQGSGAVVLKGMGAQASGFAERTVRGVWDFVNAFGYQPDVVGTMVKTMVAFVDMLHRRSADAALPSRGNLLSRYLQLVNAHCLEHRDIAFYAARLHLSQHYCSTLVSTLSGCTAKEWIDRAVTQHAQLMLQDSDLSVKQLAARLGFDSPSFFCRFFKRRVGMTPMEYRRHHLLGGGSQGTGENSPKVGL